MLFLTIWKLNFCPWRSQIQRKSFFEHLLQLYEYEFSDITKLEVNRQGLFTNVELQKHLDEGSCRPYLMQYQGKWAGLAVVNLKSYLNDDPHVKDIAEFFLMKLYRKRRIGLLMASHLFDLFPGKWEVRQFPEATEARAFWLRVISHYTNQHFKDEFIDHSRWKGHIQTFFSKNNEIH